MNQQKSFFIIFLLAAALISGLWACSSPQGPQTGSGDGDGHDHSGGDSSGELFDDSENVPDFAATGTITTNIDANVPKWIRDNFVNIRAYVDPDDSNYLIIKTKGYPPYKSYYYGSGHSQYDSTEPAYKNPNTISEQAFTLRVPLNPVQRSGTPDQSWESGMGIIGVAVNGVPIFNNSAQPPDVLVNEIPTMDPKGGHPTNDGTYHYHILSSGLVGNATDGSTGVADASGNDVNTLANDSLLGIAKDGFPIFGPENSGGTLVFNAGGDPNGSTDTDPYTQDNWHSDRDTSLHADTGVPSPHYHVVSNYFQVTTGGTPTGVPGGQYYAGWYMIGTYLGGVQGTTTSAASRQGVRPGSGPGAGSGPARGPRQ